MKKTFSVFLNFLFIFNFSNTGIGTCAPNDSMLVDVKIDNLSTLKCVDEDGFRGKRSFRFNVDTAMNRTGNMAGRPDGTEKFTLTRVNSSVSSINGSKSTEKLGVVPLKVSDDPESFAKFVSDKKAIVFDVAYDTMFGQILLDVSNKRMREAGFEYGDSVDVHFSNGRYLLDIPYFSGYSTRTGEPLLVCYHGDGNLAVCRNNWDSLWKEAKLQNGDSAAIKIREKGKFLDTERALSLVYSKNRSDYESDETFANYRECVGGKMPKGIVFRCASPFDDKYNRIECVNKCMKKDGIAFIINLSDTQETIEDIRGTAEKKDCYACNLYEKGQCVCLGMACNYCSKDYARKLVKGLVAYVEYCERYNNGEPAKLVIHCLEGKDRTGFACVLLLMLCNASYQEMLNDYMKTYENYYGITEQSDPKKYKAIRNVKFNEFVNFLSEGANLGYVEAAVAYLRYGGMSDTQIENLMRLISKVNQ